MSDELHEYDLSAWEAPAPPAGLADAVLARVREPAAVGAVEQESRPVRWWWIGAAVAAAAAVIFLVFALGGTEHAPPAFGAVAADRARTLDLATATAELENGALVTWRREGTVLHALQPRGSVSWHVERDETLRVDLDAIPASIKATGASLRVEVHMNISDARVIGASALTAAAVAFATVVVYEGHVEVSSGGQTVQIEPGATVQLEAGKPPAPPDLVGERERIRRLEQRLAELEGKTWRGGVKPGAALVDPDIAPASVVVRACGLKHGYSGTWHVSFTVRGGSFDPATFQLTGDHAMGSGSVDDFHDCIRDALAQGHYNSSHDFAFTVDIPPQEAKELTKELISAGMNAVKPTVMACTTPKAGIVKLHVVVAPSGEVTEAKVTQAPDGDLSDCVGNAVLGATFAKTTRGGSFSYPFVFEATRTVPGKCDADALEQKAMDDEATGQHAAALQVLERELACRTSPRAIQLAFMTACNSNNVAKAKKYYKKLSPDMQTRISMMCVRQGITVDQLSAP